MGAMPLNTAHRRCEGAPCRSRSESSTPAASSPWRPSDSQEKVLAAVANAETKAVTLTDDKGRKVFVPAGSLAYIELGEAEPRRVGFGI